MPAWPVSERMLRVRKTSRTMPPPLCMWNIGPSAVTMPAASWPRCCRTSSPSYSSWLTGLLATTPSIPHIAASVVRNVARYGLGHPGLDRTGQSLERRAQHSLVPRRLARQRRQPGEQHDEHDDQQAARQTEEAAEQAI